MMISVISVDAYCYNADLNEFLILEDLLTLIIHTEKNNLCNI